MKSNRYKCVHCGKTVDRCSDKAWVKSFCQDTGKDVHLQKCKDEKKVCD